VASVDLISLSLLALAALAIGLALRDSYRRTGFRPPASPWPLRAFGGAYFDLAAATAILKELYDGQTRSGRALPRQSGVYAGQEVDRLLRQELAGSARVRSAGGGSTTFANAQANQAPAQYAEFLVTRRREYALATLDNETAEAAGDSKGAFVDALTDVVDKAITTATLRIAPACSGLVPGRSARSPARSPPA
jgi:hypothetical protein